MDDFARYLNTDPAQGLSDEEAALRAAAGLSNVQVQARTKTVARIVRDNTCTFFSILIFALAGLVALVGSWRNMMFLIVLLINIAIGVTQEIRAKRAVEKLRVVSAPHARVVRGGRELSIGTGDVVLGDIAIFASGDQLSADGVVVGGEAEVDESLVTGEADAILKREGGELLSGSFVISGKCSALITHVGYQSYASKLSAEAKRTRKVNSQLRNSLDMIMRVAGIAVILLGVVLLAKQLITLRSSYEYAVTSTVAAVLGMIPEGLYLLTSVALAVGVVRLSRKRTLVNELHCIESLARVDVLCMDKTGTITEGVMRVNGVDITDGAYDQDRLGAAMSALLYAMEEGNATFKALATRFAPEKRFAHVRRIPFSSARKWCAAAFENGEAYALGAPEIILGDNYESVRALCEGHMSRGRRVVLLARVDDAAEPLAGALPVAVMALEDTVRPDAKETFDYFAREGVTLKLISGDNPVTVSEAALSAGITGGANYIDASMLGDAELSDAAEAYTVFGRVTPQQKRVLISALKRAGHVVAMVGDGVNDVLALRDADCSVAMASGSDAARAVADIVLLDSSFAPMPSVLLEGRRVINNIERTAALFVVKTIYSFLLSIILIFMPVEYPFVPIQLTLISTLTIGAPSFFLALEPNRARVSGNFLQKTFRRALPGALTIVVNIIIVIIVNAIGGLERGEVSTIATILAGYTGLLALLNASVPLDVLRGAVLAVMTAAFSVALSLFGRVFFLVDLGSRGLTTLVILMLTTAPMMLLLAGIIRRTRLVERIARRMNK
jgi:cation-transporting ATPase E